MIKLNIFYDSKFISARKIIIYSGSECFEIKLYSPITYGNIIYSTSSDFLHIHELINSSTKRVLTKKSRMHCIFYNCLKLNLLYWLWDLHFLIDSLWIFLERTTEDFSEINLFLVHVIHFKTLIPFEKLLKNARKLNINLKFGQILS